MKRPWRLLPSLLFALAVVPTAAAQGTNLNADFVRALAQFSLGLDGAFGDEGPGILSSLDLMERGLARWDATVRAYEERMTAEIKVAEPGLAARMHTALGGVYLDRGRVVDALREFEAANQLDPRRADVHTFAGLAYSQLADRPDAATEAFRRASSLDPRNPVRLYVLARQLRRVGKPEEANTVLRAFQESATPLQPNREAASLFMRLGLVQERSEVEPFFPPVLYAEGFSLLQRGDYAAAVAQFRKAAARDPLTPGLQATDPLSSAAAAFRDGLIDVATERLKAAAAATPDRADVHRLLGRVHLANDQVSDAIRELKSAVRLRPDDERSHIALADALVETGQYQAAEDALRNAIKALPASGRARYALGRLYQRQGLSAQALRELGEAVTFGPLLGLNGIYQAIGAMSAARQDFDAAIDAYVKRIDIHPNDPGAHFDLGQTFFRLGRHEEALAEFLVVLMLSPRHSRTYAAVAQVHLRDGHYDAAVESARHALDLDPTDRQARYTVATALVRLGRTDEGKQELDTFERLQAESAVARAQQLELEGLKREAALSSTNGNYARAVALLRKALPYEPAAPSAHFDLGVALVRAGQPAEAIERFKSAVALKAPLDVHRNLAEAYAALGQLEESRREQSLYQQMKQEQLRRAGRNF